MIMGVALMDIGMSLYYTKSNQSKISHMAITLDPKRVAIGPGQVGNPPQRAPRQPNDQPAVAIPAKAQENYIPGPASLDTLIGGAIAAKRQGASLDRGTILNILA